MGSKGPITRHPGLPRRPWFEPTTSHCLISCSTGVSLHVALPHRSSLLEATETVLNIRALFERHYASLVWFLHGRLGDRDLAEDLAQEVFVRLMEKPPREPDSWMYVVAGNLARDAQRGELRRARHLAVVRAQSDGPGGEADPAPGADARMCGAEESALVRETLSRLSERDAALLVMRADDVSYREIAAAIGVAPTSVGPLLARAQRRFIRALGSRADERNRGSDARASN
jgi:RNA polymerase sigma-70 factor (ECF subfamily)